jgi:hypothetical protein
VRVIHHEVRVVRLAQLEQRAERREVAVHRVDVFDDDDAPARGGAATQLRGEVVQVVVSENYAPRARQPRAINQRGVHERVT